MKQTIIIRKGADLGLLNKAIIAFRALEKVQEGSPCYHTYVELLHMCKKEGFLLSDIGTTDAEISNLCHIGSRNVVALQAKLLEALKQTGSEESISASQEIIADEVKCGHLSLQDLKELGALDFAVYLPAEGKV